MLWTWRCDAESYVALNWNIDTVTLGRSKVLPCFLCPIADDILLQIGAVVQVLLALA